MWKIDTLWFDISLVMSLCLVGHILFGHFEDYKPKWRRILKVVLATAIFASIATWCGRVWAYGFLTIPLIGALLIHCWWLPKHGIHGWTGEPRDKYLKLVGKKK